MSNLPEIIATEVMDAIERNGRINKDDLIMAAQVAIGKHERANVSQGVPYEDLTTRDMQNILTEQAMAEAVKESKRLAETARVERDRFVAEVRALRQAKPGCLSSAEAAQKAGLYGPGVPVSYDCNATPSPEHREMLVQRYTQMRKEIDETLSIRDANPAESKGIVVWGSSFGLPDRGSAEIHTKDGAVEIVWGDGNRSWMV